MVYCNYNIFPTIIVCGMDLLLKDHLPKMYPKAIYNAEFNRDWPKEEFDRYIKMLKNLSSGGMYHLVWVPHNAVIRKALDLEGIKYTNATPDDTPEMLDYYMTRYAQYHKLAKTDMNPKFTKNQFKTIFGSLKNDPNSVTNIVFSKENFDGWDFWLSGAR